MKIILNNLTNDTIHFDNESDNKYQNIYFNLGEKDISITVDGESIEVVVNDASDKKVAENKEPGEFKTKPIVI